MASNESSLICDPFSGSSTTGIGVLNRKFIGFEKENEFIEISIARKKELENNFNAIKNKINDLKLLDKNSLFQGDYL